MFNHYNGKPLRQKIKDKFLPEIRFRYRNLMMCGKAKSLIVSLLLGGLTYFSMEDDFGHTTFCKVQAVMFAPLCFLPNIRS